MLALALLTLLVLLLVQGSLVQRWRLEPAGEAAPPPEEVVYVSPVAPAEPEPAREAPTPAAPPVIERPAAPPTRAPAVPAAPRDTVARPRTPSAAPGARPAVPLPTIPGPVTGGEPAAPLCWPPCIEGRVGPGRAAPPLTGAARDSALRAMGERVAREGDTRRPGPVLGGGPAGAASPVAPPSVGAGVSIPVGLPGGGPTRAQRQRDSTVNADVQARLARLRARQDSIAQARRDSLEAARRVP